VASRNMGSPTIALLSSLMFLLNFAVPNLLLAGLVDSGEAFFLMALVGILSTPSGSFSSLSPPYWGRSQKKHSFHLHWYLLELRW
jgi:hypothetical protein